MQFYLDNPDGKRVYGEGAFSQEHWPVDIRNGDQYAVVDGTHRFLAAYLSDKPYLEAVVVDLA